MTTPTDTQEIWDLNAHFRGSAMPNGAHWKRSQQTFWMAKACVGGRIDLPIGFHGLRHTWASLAVMAGMPLMAVARALGHADTRMVEKHYGHLAPDFINQAIRANAPKFGIELERPTALITSRTAP